MPNQTSTMQSITLDQQERAVLSALADVLIPAGEGFPSASQAGVAGDGLEKVLSCRAELADALRSVVTFARTRNAFEAVAELKKTEPALFGALAEFAAGAYFLNDAVCARLNYHGQTPRPIETRADYLDDDLLQSVIDRGPIYRPTPAGKSK
jgi:hypothetical protein